MKKSSIFDRLRTTENADSTQAEPLVRMVNVSKSTSSIFNRLGGKNNLEKEKVDKTVGFAGILKNSPAKNVRSFLSSTLN